MAAKTNELKVTLPSDREIQLVREFDAPAALVFEASTKPEYVKQWHADMGFHEGWGKTLDQLVALAKRM